MYTKEWVHPTFIVWLISIIIHYFSKTKNKKLKEEAKKYLFRNDEYDDF